MPRIRTVTIVLALLVAIAFPGIAEYRSRPHRMARVADGITRDPFAGSPIEGTDPISRELDIRTGTDIAPVPNIDGSAFAADGTQPTVRATIVGPNPVAYVDDGSTMQLVRIGDVVAGRNVASIDLRGLGLSDGTRLDLPDAPRSGSARYGAQTAPPVRRSPAARVARPTPTAAARPPIRAPASAVPTAAPLQTPDSHGLAPGVNPTPDAADPTAFPYPYPYAPPHR